MYSHLPLSTEPSPQLLLLSLAHMCANARTRGEKSVHAEKPAQRQLSLKCRFSAANGSVAARRVSRARPATLSRLLECEKRKVHINCARISHEAAAIDPPLVGGRRCPSRRRGSARPSPRQRTPGESGLFRPGLFVRLAAEGPGDEQPRPSLAQSLQQVRTSRRR